MPLNDANIQNKIFIKNSNCNVSDVYSCLMNLSPAQILEATPWYMQPFQLFPL